jgi:membrane-bound ClpP family serine protease
MLLPLIGLVLFLVLSWKIALPIYLALLVAWVFYERAIFRSQRLPVRTGGVTGMIGRPATVLTWHGGRGTVRFGTEIWNAQSPSGDALPAGGEVKIVGAEGLILLVVTADSGKSEDERRAAG